MNLVVYHVDPIFNKKNGGSKHHSGGDISNQAVVNDEYAWFKSPQLMGSASKPLDII